MNDITIITLSGHIGSGKDEVAKLLVNQFGYKSYMLAGLAKSVISQVYGLSLEDLEDREKKEQYRELVIEFAEKMKEIDLFVHCKYVYQLIKKELSLKGCGNFVISDVRYPYEFNYFSKMDRCSKYYCEIEYEGLKGYQVTHKSLYIESDLADKSSKKESESYQKHLKSISDGVILNGTEQRYNRKDKVNTLLLNQLIKFL